MAERFDLPRPRAPRAGAAGWRLGPRRRAGLVLALLALGLLAGPVTGGGPVSYGELELASLSEPKGQPLHGYTEFRVYVRNRSKEQSHRVTLSLPSDTLRGNGISTLAISRTVEVGPDLTVPVSFFQPVTPDVLGGGLAVRIDGRLQERAFDLAPASRQGGMYSYHRMGGYKGMTTGQPLVLVSTGVPEKFFQRDAAPAAFPLVPGGLGGPAPPFPGAAGGVPAGFPGAPGRVAGPAVLNTINAQFVRADLGGWGDRWLGYTRYDGVVVTCEDLEHLSRTNETRAVLRTLWQFAETGGVLLVLGPGKPAVPAPWKGHGSERDGLTTYPVGFGLCIVSADRDPAKWDQPVRQPGAHPGENRWTGLHVALSQTVRPWSSSAYNLTSLNTDFPVIDDLGVPVRGLFALMILFAVALGPVNLVVLARKNKRIWMLWTVPAISMATCAAVFGYMIVAEGWQGHARVSGLTFLDETQRRAASVGRTAFYSPLTPGDGLRFSEDTEAQVLAAGEGGLGSSCQLDWTQGQHLASGWVTARIPAHFKLRKSEARRERLNVRRTPGGGLEVVNALGADVVSLWLADEKGTVYQAGALAAGGRATLGRADHKPVQRRPAAGWRALYTQDNWGKWATEAPRPADVLGPRMYLAVVEGSPFLEQGLKGAAVRPSRSVVVGLMASGAP